MCRQRPEGQREPRGGSVLELAAVLDDGRVLATRASARGIDFVVLEGYAISAADVRTTPSARRLADEAREPAVDEGVDVLAQVQAEAAATWRSPSDGKPTRATPRLPSYRGACELDVHVVSDVPPAPMR